MESTPSPPPWSVVEFTFSNKDTNSELVLMCNYQRFIIHLFEENFTHSESLRNKYLFFLNVAENYELDGHTVEDFHDWIAEPLLPVLRDLPEAATGRTLHDFLFPETHRYTISADGDQLTAVRLRRNQDTDPIFGVEVSEDACTSWPFLDPRQLQIHAEAQDPRPSSSTPSMIRLHDGSFAFLKLARPGDKRSLMNEIDTYRRIQDASLDETLNIPRLLGIVRNEERQVFGLLLSYINCRRTTLHCASKPGTQRHLKQKWALQITRLLDKLHEADVVWGDVKPDNVLIDRDENAWLIDFGGGYTEGWVPKELAGSLQGDSEGLKKLLDFIDAS